MSNNEEVTTTGYTIGNYCGLKNRHPVLSAAMIRHYRLHVKKKLMTQG